MFEISYTFNDKFLTFSGTPGQEDIDFFSARKGSLKRHSAEFEIPDGLDVESMHPDILGLIAMLIYGPFIRRSATLSWAVSRDFAETVERHFRRKINPVDPDLAKRVVLKNSRPSLAFSGGVDSFAALALLPPNTVPIFCNRTRPDGFPVGMYRADAAIKACQDIKKSHDVFVINTDMEYIREPVGFPVDWSNAVGAALLADYLNINSVSFGMIMESAYFIGHPHYSDLRTRSIYSAWAPMFDAVSMPISLPTSGLSEVVTSKIAATKSAIWHPESCVRGLVGQPCMRCFKCFRKTILDHRISGQHLDGQHFEIARASREVKRRLLEIPVHHEDVLAYSVSKLNSDPNPILQAIQEKMKPMIEYGEGLDLLERYYSRSVELIPAFLVDGIEKEISKYAKPYSDQDFMLIENWDTMPLTLNATYQQGQVDLSALLEPIAAS